MSKQLERNAFYHGDCLFILNHDIPEESIDLIYLDPPFFTGKVQKGKDKWHPEAMEISYDDTKAYWGQHQEEMRRDAPVWLNSIPGSPEFKSYLYYMMKRLEACRKVLRDTGSIYLHCDWRASHYLKMIMDWKFGYENFRNEIVWHYHSGGSAPKHWARKHDILLFYTKTSQYTFNIQREPYNAIIAKKRRHLFHLDGKGMDDVFEIPMLSTVSKERVGYPTQKPEALLKRIIEASSNVGDIVLDPFCGCGTAIVASHWLDRRWIGIDINEKAWEVIHKKRINQMSLFYQESFRQATYVSRDLTEIKQKDSKQFEIWVNEFYNAKKPWPDKGVDGFTVADEIPIQTKTFKIGYEVLSQFITDAKYHPKRTKPITKVIVVSQIGFDNTARQRKEEIEIQEEIEVILMTPEKMLTLKIG